MGLRTDGEARAIRVRSAQLAAGGLDVSAAVDDVIGAIDGAAATTDLLVLPELATTRYDIRRGIGDLAPQPGGEEFDRIIDAVRRAGLVLVLGFLERQHGTLFNSAMVLDRDGSISGVVRKTHLFAGESKVFAAGELLEPVDTSVGRLGVQICYDMEFPEVCRTLTMKGAQVLVASSANMHPYTPYHEVYCRARAMENGLPLVVSNWVGQGPRFDFLGRSSIVSSTGEVLADAGVQPGHASAEVSIAPISQVDPDVDYLAYRRPELYA
jgi:predicted amidohydrolase